MIDGFTAILFDNLDDIRQLPNLDFCRQFSEKTGEIDNYKPSVASYKGLKISNFQKHIKISGSLHVFFNNGRHNYDDFSFENIQNALSRLAEEIHVNLRNAKLQNLELGVNLVLQDDPKKIIDSVIIHRGKEFSLQYSPNQYFKECSHSQYFIKIYDKGIQYRLSQNILRCEVKFRKMERINRMGITSLHDLNDIGKLRTLSGDLIRIFNDILFGDLSADKTILSSKDQILFAEGHNAANWKRIIPVTDHFPLGSKNKEYIRQNKVYERRLARFKKIMKDTGGWLLQADLIHSINTKVLELLDNAKIVQSSKTEIIENRGKMTSDHYAKISEDASLNRRISGEIDRQIEKGTEEERIESVANKTGENDPLLYSVNFRQLIEGPKICPVTGLDISMQKRTSRFLCASGIKYYKDNNPAIWDKLKQRLSPKWLNCDEKVQIREVHHSVRNQFYNPILNTRRRIIKILRSPALFDQKLLIRKEKLMLACLTL